MFMVRTDGHDDDEILVCQLCRQEFTTVKRAYLAWPVDARQGAEVPTIWAHRRCLDGQALTTLGTGGYRLKRVDFAFRSLLQRLLFRAVV